MFLRSKKTIKVKVAFRTIIIDLFKLTLMVHSLPVSKPKVLKQGLNKCFFIGRLRFFELVVKKVKGFCSLYIEEATF